MGAKLEIRCDGCDRDIAYTGNSVDYRLVLSSQNKPILPGIGSVTDVFISPDIDRDHYFCGAHCLELWVNRP